MRDLAALNINRGGRPVGRSPPSDLIIQSFEREFGVSLPEDYISLLAFSNGGHPELDTIVPLGGGEIAERAVDHFFYLDSDKEGIESLWAATRAWRNILGDDKIPFAIDAGGNPFVFDFSVIPPRILACLHDENFEFVEIANSFSEFIDRLEIDPDCI